MAFTLPSAPDVGRALYCALIVAALVPLTVAISVCPLSVVTVFSPVATTKLRRKQSFTVVVRELTTAVLFVPELLVALTLMPPSLRTAKATMTERSLTPDVTV